MKPRILSVAEKSINAEAARKFDGIPLFDYAVQQNFANITVYIE